MLSDEFYNSLPTLSQIFFRTSIRFYNFGTRNKIDNIKSRLDFMNRPLRDNGNEHEFPVKSFRAMPWRIVGFRMTHTDSLVVSNACH
jgi:hypothetical protein